MLRTLRIWISAALWSAAIAAAFGLLEGLQQLVRLGLPDDWGFAPDPLRLLVPPMAVYGWFGFGAALLLAPLATVIGHLRRRPAAFAWQAAVAGAVAALGAVYAGYLLEGRLLADRRGGGGGWADALLVLVWLAGLAVLWRPAGRLGRLLADRSPAVLLAPGLLLLVVTGVWPDWRLEEARLRTQGLPAEAAPPAGAPAVVLVTIDAWRADRLSRLNPSAPPTPALDRLAAESVVFRNAFAPSPWTLPSMAAIMTGLPPRVLGVAPHLPLPAGAPTLAELAWRHGYRTAAFATNAYLVEWYGFARGFDFFEHAGELESLLPARRSVLAREAARHARQDLDPDAGGFVVPKVPLGVGWLRRQAGRLGALPDDGPGAAKASDGAGPPLFLWVHLLDPHLPYTWRELPRPAAGAAAAAGSPPPREAVPTGGFFAGGELSLPALHGIRDGTWAPDPAERAGVAALYDREIQYVDHWFGRLREHLERLGVWDEAIVLVLADHGEELFEHGSFEHGHSVLPEVVRVPLLLRLPGGREGGRVVEAPVWTADVVPTLCSLLGWALPPGVDGRAFWPPAAEAPVADATAGADPLAATAAATGRPVLLIENMLYGEPQQGLLAWPLYAVRRPEGGPPAWYDLARDPLARSPIPAPPAAARIQAAADSMAVAWSGRAALRDGAADAARVLPEELRQQMRALGYVR